MESWARAVLVVLAPELAMLGVSVATIPNCPHYAELARMLASRFPAHLSCTGISLSCQLCGTLLGGTTPVIGQFLLNRNGPITADIAYAIFQVALTRGCMLLLLKRLNYDAQCAGPAVTAPRTVSV